MEYSLYSVFLCTEIVLCNHYSITSIEERKQKNEKNVSAFENQKTAQMRIQSQNGDPRRTRCACPSSCERPEKTRSLTEMPSARMDTPSAENSSGKHRFRLRPDCKMKLKSEFDSVKNGGRRITAQSFIMLVSGGVFGASLKCGIICSRKFDKRAVKRNRARRLLWEAFRLTGTEISPCGIILIPRRGILRMKMQDVRAAFADALKKAGMMKNPGTECLRQRNV